MGSLLGEGSGQLAGSNARWLNCSLRLHLIKLFSEILIPYFARGRQVSTRYLLLLVVAFFG